MMRSRTDSDGGFALLAVLWVLVGLAAVAMVSQLAAREAVQAATNRADLAVARWRAEDCLERARAVIADVVWRARNDGPDAPGWTSLDRTVENAPLLAGCDVRLRSAGAVLDVNRADDEMLRRFFAAAGASPARADSLSDALADWRDADDEPRPLGAEAAWYAAAGLPAPRDGALRHPREALRVRGMDALPGIDSMIGVEPARVDLSNAPLPVIAALPGVTPELVARLGELRFRGQPVGEITSLPGLLSPEGATTLSRAFAELSVLTAPRPDVWIVEARAGQGTPPVVAVAEARIVRAGPRAAVVRRRAWVGP